MSTYGGTNIFCPFCKDVQVCSSVYKSGEPIGMVSHIRGYKKPDKLDLEYFSLEPDEIAYFRRWRKCKACGNEFSTAEIFEEELTPLDYGLYRALLKKLSKDVNDRPVDLIHALKRVLYFLECFQSRADSVAKREDELAKKDAY